MEETKETTHVIYYWPSNDLERLFRASDGVEIAVRQNAVCILGADPNRRTSRHFLDEQFAHDYLKIAAKDDLAANGGGDPVIEEISQEREGMIVAPPGATDLNIALPGSMRKTPLTKLN